MLPAAFKDSTPDVFMVFCMSHAIFLIITCIIPMQQQTEITELKKMTTGRTCKVKHDTAFT